VAERLSLTPFAETSADGLNPGWKASKAGLELAFAGAAA
jgi:hypothetical protein